MSSSVRQPEVIERLGDKASAKREAEAAGVPTVPGSKTPSEDAAEIARIVRELGLPVMLKAAAGGGGKGMRAVSHLDGLAGEIESAMREAKNSFGYRRADRRKADRARTSHRSADRR